MDESFLLRHFMSARALRSLFVIELKKALSYRFDFWVQFVGAVVIQVLVAWFLWSAVFRLRGVAEIGGYSFSLMMFYYLLVPLIDRLNRGYDNFVFSNEIYTGALTRYLLYPVPFFLYRFAGITARSVMSLLQLGIGVGFFALLFGLPEGLESTASSLLLGFALCAVSVVCYFLLSSIVEMVAFWADNVWSLMVILRFSVQIAGGGLLPLDLFPEWARTVLMYTPFPHFLFVPIRLLMGQAGLREFLFSVSVLGLWTVGFGLVCRWVWRAGSKEYSGVGI